MAENQLCGTLLGMFTLGPGSVGEISKGKTIAFTFHISTYLPFCSLSASS